MTKMQNDFLYIVATHAVRLAHKSGIPPSVVIAQAILESNWGTSELAVKANNLFGIKAHEWKGAVYQKKSGEYVNGKYVEIVSWFRKYPTIVQSLEDHDKFLQRPIYAAANEYKSNPLAYAWAIAKCGYATDPKYAIKLSNVIATYHLRKYDALVKKG